MYVYANSYSYLLFIHPFFTSFDAQRRLQRESNGLTRSMYLNQPCSWKRTGRLEKVTHAYCRNMD